MNNTTDVELAVIDPHKVRSTCVIPETRQILFEILTSIHDTFPCKIVEKRTLCYRNKRIRREKMHRYLFVDVICSEGIDNVQANIYWDIFKLIGCWCVYYSSRTFATSEEERLQTTEPSKTGVDWIENHVRLLFCNNSKAHLHLHQLLKGWLSSLWI